MFINQDPGVLIYPDPVEVRERGDVLTSVVGDKGCILYRLIAEGLNFTPKDLTHRHNFPGSLNYAYTILRPFPSLPPIQG